MHAFFIYRIECKFREKYNFEENKKFDNIKWENLKINEYYKSAEDWRSNYF